MRATEPSQAPEHWYEANAVVASALREAADLLKAQDASPFRILAYLKAATTIEDLDDDISEIANQGMAALDAIPNIGVGIGAAILELVSTGRWSQLDRLRGGLEPEAAFRSIPGVGPRLARLIHEHLHVETLESLEAAAHDGRLAKVPGIGPQRLAIIRNALSSILSRRGMGGISRMVRSAPPVDLLLDVDHEYRTKAQAGKLRQIAPKRFNPGGKAWLPILHTERGNWQFTALYSNTARAHNLRRTDDWVIISFSTDHQPEGQCTVVTETSGLKKGQRVVRGRENECKLR